ncbi:MAG TPA: hypothetical protein VF796_23725, partial [Humisphaera sp.]
KAKAGEKFVADRLLPDSPTITYENALITLRAAKPDPAKANAGLVALSVDARLAKKAAAAGK